MHSSAGGIPATYGVTRPGSDRCGLPSGRLLFPGGTGGRHEWGQQRPRGPICACRGGAAQQALVRTGPVLVRTSGSNDAVRLLPRGLRREAGRRDRDDVVGGEPLSCPPPGRGRRRQAGRLGGGWVPARDPGDVPGRDVDEADHDALPQSGGDGDRGSTAQSSLGCRRPPGRLRQDDARSPDGRGRARTSPRSTCPPDS